MNNFEKVAIVIIRRRFLSSCPAGPISARVFSSAADGQSLNNSSSAASLLPLRTSNIAELYALLTKGRAGGRMEATEGVEDDVVA